MLLIGRILLLSMVAAGMGGLVAWLSVRYPGVLDERGNRIGLVATLGWFALVASAAIVHFRHRPAVSTAGRAAVVWVALGAVLVLGYSYRHDAADIASRVRVELLPASPVAEEGGAVSFRAGAGGHYTVEADVDGVRVRFLIDTGATRVVLSPADARRLGFEPDALNYTQPAETANGIVMGAPVRLDRIRIGSIEIAGVGAMVNGAEMRESLLGMSLLNRLGGFEVRDGVLTLRP